jgi:hypothetical protein
MRYILTKAIALLAAIWLLPACQQDELTTDNPTDYTTDVSDPAQTLGTLSQLFAQIMQDSVVLNFLHKQADEKFDRDYDVLIALVKDQALAGSNRTLVDHLAAAHGSREAVIAMLDAHPLLTLFRPETLGNNNRRAAPLVALKVGDKMIAYDQSGQLRNINAQTPPAQTAVWGLKQNERVVLGSDKRARHFQAGRSIGTTSNGTALILPEVFDPEQSANARFDLATEYDVSDPTVPPKAKYSRRNHDALEAYWVGKGCDHCTYRDRIYWGITRTKRKGNGGYSVVHEEEIPWIRPDSLPTYNLLNKDGWIEGDYELEFRLYKLEVPVQIEKKSWPKHALSSSTNARSSAANEEFPELPGVFPLLVRDPSVPAGTPGTENLPPPPPDANAPVALSESVRMKIVSPHDLFEFDENGNPISTKTKIWADDPVRFNTWNPLYWGDKVKIVLYEYDNGVEIEELVTHTTTLGTNFELTVDGIPLGLPEFSTPLGKIGFSLGGFFQSRRARTETITLRTVRNDESDFLGERVIHYIQPLIKDEVPGSPAPPAYDANGYPVDIATAPYQYFERTYTVGGISFPFQTVQIN